MKNTLIQKKHWLVVILAAALLALLAVVQPAQVAHAQTGNPAADFVITVKTDNAGTSGSTQFTIPTLFRSDYQGEISL